MDGDPHGIDIHVVYKWGGRVSNNLLVVFTRQILIQFQLKCHHNEILTCPDIQWLGINSQDIKRYAMIVKTLKNKKLIYECH
jgi:DNA topoisomerase VI subunit A